MGERRNPSRHPEGTRPPPLSGEGESDHGCQVGHSVPAPPLRLGEGDGYPLGGGRGFVASVTARVLASRRYRHVDPALVDRLAAEEEPKAKNLADAEKRTKRRLHQIFGAYTGQPAYARLMLDLATAWQGEPDEAVRAACRTAMAAHASTRERLAILDEFYERVFTITGVPTSIVDIACGL
ncbi:MAG TPA: hypothetical protein VEX37_08175, partial [Thermomicrobiales bacterium]|nr:hypothetical protein [Thermomicrobiales bacterium]